MDLFTVNTAAESFTDAVERATATLVENGYMVSMPRSAPLFARRIVARGSEQVEVDFGADWRAHQPVTFSVGPVLAIEDAVANKVGALYSRAAARDFLDVDSIRQSGRFSDAELLRLAAEHDPGFEDAMFADQLRLVANLDPASVAEYEVTEEQLMGVRERLLGWRHSIVSSILGGGSRPEPWQTIDQDAHTRRHEPPGTALDCGRGISL